MFKKQKKKTTKISAVDLTISKLDINDNYTYKHASILMAETKWLQHFFSLHLLLLKKKHQKFNNINKCLCLFAKAKAKKKTRKT